MDASRLKRFYEKTRTAKKIVVVDLGYLGDSVHLIPALWELKRHYQAEVHVVAAELGAEVLRLAPCVDRCWAARRSWRDQWRLIRALRREKFDLAFNFSGSDRTIILTALTGARWRMAHAGGHRHFWNRWLIPDWAPRQDPEATILEQRRRVLTACGCELEPPRFDLRLDEASQEWAAKNVSSGAVHLSINSANPLKEWPLDYHAALLQTIWERHPGLPVVASAARKERERVRLRQLRKAVPDSRLKLLPDDLSIARLAGVLKQCSLHIGPDSGVMHLAWALGVPTVAYFREQPGYKAWLPRGPAHRFLTVPCQCIDHHDCPCEKTGVPVCLARISPAQMAEIVCGRLAAAPARFA